MPFLGLDLEKAVAPVNKQWAQSVHSSPSQPNLLGIIRIAIQALSTIIIVPSFHPMDEQQNLP